MSGWSLSSSGPAQPGHDGGVGAHNVGNLDFLKKVQGTWGCGAHPSPPLSARLGRGALLRACEVVSTSLSPLLLKCALTTGYRRRPSAPAHISQTSIMAVKFDGGVIGADSRTSTGAYIANRVSDKVTAIDDRIYVCRSGSAADTQAISDYVTYFMAGHKMEMARRPSRPPPTSSASSATPIRTCSWRASSSWLGPSRAVRSTDSRWRRNPERPYAIGGSGSTYIYGFCDAYYREGMNKDQCLEFVRKALAHAMARDGSSGGASARLSSMRAGRAALSRAKVAVRPL